jgi:hypothetical protein
MVVTNKRFLLFSFEILISHFVSLRIAANHGVPLSVSMYSLKGALNQSQLSDLKYLY